MKYPAPLPITVSSSVSCPRATRNRSGFWRTVSKGAAVDLNRGGASGFCALADQGHQVARDAEALFEFRDAFIDLAEKRLVLQYPLLAW
jgi:hypothetical protein